MEYRPELESKPNMSFHLKEKYFRYMFAYEQQLTNGAVFQQETIKTYVQGCDCQESLCHVARVHAAYRHRPSESGRKRRLSKRSSSIGDLEVHAVTTQRPAMVNACGQ